MSKFRGFIFTGESFGFKLEMNGALSGFIFTLVPYSHLQMKRRLINCGSVNRMKKPAKCSHLAGFSVFIVF